MPSDSRQSERRKHKRFNVKDLAIAVPNRPSSQIARIVKSITSREIFKLHQLRSSCGVENFGRKAIL